MTKNPRSWRIAAGCSLSRTISRSMVPQFATGGVMRERLAELGHRPRFGCELHGFEQDDTGLTVRIADLAARKLCASATWQARIAGLEPGQACARCRLPGPGAGHSRGCGGRYSDGDLYRDAWHRFKGGPTGLPMSLCPLAGYRPFPVAGSCSAGGRARFVRRRTYPPWWPSARGAVTSRSGRCRGSRPTK